MGKTKPPYPEAFKQQIVELAMAGRTPAELSREFGVAAQSITAGWRDPRPTVATPCAARTS
jgi:transposase